MKQRMVFNKKTITNPKLSGTIEIYLFVIQIYYFTSFSFSGPILCILNHHIGVGAKRFLLLYFPVAALLCIPKVFSLNITNDMIKTGYRSIPKDFEETQSLVYINRPAFPAINSRILSITKKDSIPKNVFLLSASFDAKITV